MDALKCPHLLVRIALFLLAAAPLARTQVIENHGLRVNLDAATASVRSVQNLLTGETYSLAERSPFSLVVDGQTLSAAEFRLASPGGSVPRFRFSGGGLDVALEYRSVAGHDFIEKTLTIRNTSSTPVLVERVTLADFTAKASELELHAHRDPSVYAWLINVFVRGEKGGLYAGVENAFGEARSPAGTLRLSFQPRWRLAPGEAFECEPMFLGAYRKEGVYVFREAHRLAVAASKPNVPQRTRRLDQEVLDWGEVWAMQRFIEAIMPPQDYEKPGYYLRAIGPVDDVATSKVFVDQVVSLGHIPHIEWNTWIAAKDPGKPAVWVASTGPRPTFIPNAGWLEVANYARQKGIASGMMEAVPNSFYGTMDAWLVRTPDGQPWGKRDRICLANPDFIRWYVGEYARMVREHHLYMLAWDSPVWFWLQFPEPVYECYAKNHGHTPGDVRYAVWRGLASLYEGLHAQFPRLAMRVAAGFEPGYPWILKHINEHHTGMYDNEPGGSWWESRNYRFIPAYKTGTSMAAANREQLRYLFFRSLSVSDHAMLWYTDYSTGRSGLPSAPGERQFFHKWMNWADANLAYLRVRRDLFREPWGDDFVNGNHVDMEGNFPWPDPQIHGSAHCIGDRGFIFLFNPAKRERVAEVPVNHWLGLETGEQFGVRELFPQEGRSRGNYARGTVMKVAVPAQSAMLLEVSAALVQPAEPPSPLPAGAPLDKAFLRWDEIPWNEIMKQP